MIASCLSSAEVMDQKKKLSEIGKLIAKLTGAEIERLTFAHCDMICEMCSINFKSLPDAQYHYLHAHNITEGFIRCCSYKFKSLRKLHGHLIWHKMPNVFK